MRRAIMSLVTCYTICTSCTKHLCDNLKSGIKVYQTYLKMNQRQPINIERKALQEKSENQPAINIEPLKDFLWAGIYLEGCVLNLTEQGDKENNTHKIETAKKLFSILNNANKCFNIYEK